MDNKGTQTIDPNKTANNQGNTGANANANANAGANADPNANKGQQSSDKKEDLLTRVSKFGKDTNIDPNKPPVDDFKFDVKDLEKIQDPKAREYAENAYKSFQRGFNTKFQELATIRKDFETKMGEANNWNPEKLRGLLSNPDFIDAIKTVTGIGMNASNTITDESLLSEDEKKLLNENNQKVNSLMRQNAQLLKTQQDEGLKGKYANYNPEAVDIITSDMLAGKVQATREHLWKVIDYDEAVHRAYKLGVEDGQKEIGVKTGATAIDGTATVDRGEVPPKNDGESDRAYFKRLFLWRQSQSKSSGVRK